MKIIFTNSIFYLQKKGGISRYYVNLAKKLNNTSLEHKIVAPLSKNLYLKNLKKNNFSLYIKKIPNNFIINKFNNIIFKYFLKKENPDIIHETYYNSKNFEILKNKIKIVTVYDLIHEKFPSLYQKEKKYEKQKILKTADHFICISKKTQEDLINHYKISPKKTSVIYVGSRANYKNFELLVKAIKILKNNPKINVVCFGGGKFSKSEIDKYNLQDNFINIQGDDELLSFLYSKAFALVNTSRYEGFGITNIEAMQLGCPVISSDFKALKEIGASSCLFFKNNNHKDLSEKLKTFIFKEKIRKNFIKKGYQRSKFFTWGICAKKTEKLYEKLVKKI
jgi:glycosyltransferase involved in cell wall biosynthesis